MGKHLHAQGESGPTQAAAIKRLRYDFEQQCLRVLRCTAQALANSPGGLRFKAGTRPWLDALSECRGEVSLSVQHGA